MTASNWIHPLPSPEMFRINRVLYDIQHNREKEAAFFADKADFVGRNVIVAVAKPQHVEIRLTRQLEWIRFVDPGNAFLLVEFF